MHKFSRSSSPFAARRRATQAHKTRLFVLIIVSFFFASSKYVRIKITIEAIKLSFWAASSFLLRDLKDEKFPFDNYFNYGSRKKKKKKKQN